MRLVIKSLEITYARGYLALPFAKGRISFVRKVDKRVFIEFIDAEYFIRRRLERKYYVPTFSTHHRRFFVKSEDKIRNMFPFLFDGKTADSIALSIKSYYGEQ